jgi:PAS domain S-box-containing protein
MVEIPKRNVKPSPCLLEAPSSECFEVILNSISDGVFAVNEEWQVICFNKAAEKTLGMTREEAIGRPCHEIFRANICSGTCALRYTMETGRPVINLAIKVLDAQDNQLPITISTALLKDKKGRIIGGVETFRNLNQVKQLIKETEADFPFDGIVTGDANIKHIFEILPTIAQSPSTVLIFGETGTGKNLIANAVHTLSERRKGPFVIVNCGAMPETLLESELFGYKAGAFTGAHRDRQGRLAAAEGGTLFLDEIGDLPLSMQVKLLRFLQDHVYERLGDVRSIKADVRVVTATNRDLGKMVQEGTFRRDLYYRINVMSIEMPPLRDRLDDVPPLVQRFLERFSMVQGKYVTSISPEVLNLLMAYDFPGNVRELENIIEHAYVLCPGPTIEWNHLPKWLQEKHPSGQENVPKTFKEIEAQFILEVMERNNWNRQESAKELGIHKTTLLRKIRKLGLALPKIDGRANRRMKTDPSD